MSDLVDFIRARVDDDDRIATAALDRGPLTPEAAASGHVQNWGPERVLRECDAKRSIADDLEKWERLYADAQQRLAGSPEDADARADRNEAANALSHVRAAAVAVADIWAGHPGHGHWRA